MKATVRLLAFFALVGGPAFADGYPFDPETQQVMCDTLRVRLDDQQVESLSASGSLTLTDPQLALVHRFYPNAAQSQTVITATFNDSNEGLSDEDVDIFWVAAEEIAITLNPKVFADERLRESALADAGHAQPSDIRIAPNGQIYVGGKKASLRDAFEVIIHRSNEPGVHHRQVDVCVAPPFRSVQSPWRNDPNGHAQETAALAQAVANIFTALAKHGEAHKVIVSKSW